MPKKQFKAESKRLLDLMINSIYTHKEIFLREIISNASDAIDKLCYVSLTDGGAPIDRNALKITVSASEPDRTLIISDNGVGMTAKELEDNLGVIARSGSLDFKSSMTNASVENNIPPDTEPNNTNPGNIDIIGRFGVGFYSAFMVADSVTVISRARGESGANIWKSTGADGYTVSAYSDSENAVYSSKTFGGLSSGSGTVIILHIKTDTDDESFSEYLDGFSLKALIKKHSDYIRYPILMPEIASSDEDESASKTTDKWETVNSRTPIWQRPRNEVSDEACFEFYKDSFRDFSDPLSVLRIDAEGLFSYKAMLFIPQTAPFDFYSKGYEPGLALYSSGVLIMEKCVELLPECFRFVRGVVDSPDLSLNISREMLQHSKQLRVIAQSIEKRVRAELIRLLSAEREKYEGFHKSFGLSLKYGLLADYGAKKDLISDLLLFSSAKTQKYITLSEYTAAMPAEQPLIYYAAADTTTLAKRLPQAERVLDMGYDLLCLTEDADEFVLQVISEKDGKRFCNISADDLRLPADAAGGTEPGDAEKYADLLSAVKAALGGAVSGVKISSRLKSYPVCLTSEGDVSLEMEKYFASMPEGAADNVKAKRILELNAEHPAFSSLNSALRENPEKLITLSKILLSQALLIAGLPPEDPMEFSELVCSLF